MLLPLLQNNLQGSSVATFIGPNIADFVLAANVSMTPRSYSGLFSAATAMTFAAIGTLPTGLSLSSSGVLSGTPTVGGIFAGIVIRATDSLSNTADSNSFSITILSASHADIGGENVGGDDVGSDDVGGDDIDTPGWWVG